MARNLPPVSRAIDRSVPIARTDVRVAALDQLMVPGEVPVVRQKLIQELQDRVHLDHDTAERAADVAVQLVKERLPEQLRPYLSSQKDRDSGSCDGFLD